jgi:hypothetical protein
LVDILAYKKKIAPNLIGIYGDEKSGKSSLILNALTKDEILAGKKIYIADVDHGLESLWSLWVARDMPHQVIEPPEGTEGEKKIIPTGVDIKVVSNLDQFERYVWHLPPGYDMYFVDTISRAAKYVIKEKQPADNAPGIRAKNANMHIALYLEDVIDRLEELAWLLKFKGQSEDPPRDPWIFFLAHERWERRLNDKEESMDVVMPLIYGSAGKKMDRITSGIWHLEFVPAVTAEGEATVGRAFRTQPDPEGSIKASDRTTALKKWEPANIAKCIAKIREKRKAA